MKGRHRGRLPIDQEYSNAVSGAHDRNGARTAVPRGAECSIGDVRAERLQLRADDGAAVNLLQYRRLGRTETRCAKERAAARPQADGVVCDRREIEVRTTVGKPRTEGMGHTGDRFDGSAAQEPDAAHLLEAPIGSAHPDTTSTTRDS